MWYDADYPAGWAGVNRFLSGVMGLFNDTFNAVMTQPILVLFLSALVLAIVVYLFWDMYRTAKK